MNKMWDDLLIFIYAYAPAGDCEMQAHEQQGEESKEQGEGVNKRWVKEQMEDG